MKELLALTHDELVEELWAADPEVHRILVGSGDLHEARDRIFDHLNSLERHYFNIYSDRHYKDMSIAEKNNAKQCIRVLKNFIRTENERLTGASCLQILHALARGERKGEEAGAGFLWELIFLLRGIHGHSGIASADLSPGGERRQSGALRSSELDGYSAMMDRWMARYPSGLDAGVVRAREETKRAVLDYFGAHPEDWESYRWHIRHIIDDRETLSSIVRLEEDELEGLRLADELGVPYQLTPYYLSLFNRTGRRDFDRGVRAQVLPGERYCRNLKRMLESGDDLDFMKERWTTPIPGVTRRYPQILIIKPFDACPQICVYCQRNWEIRKLREARLDRAKVKRALEWVRGNEAIKEVLVTGGDPLALPNNALEWVLGELAEIEHVERIRIGTRTPVTLPFRIDRGFLKLLRRYHEWGEREVCIVTHFEYPSELTPEALGAIKRLRALGISVHNQQVFTYYNSRRFETAKLRRVLRLCGVLPYYTFNTKGKDETVDFRVPLARIEQEVAEEARLLPGVIRTDEPVFNVPRLGKSYLRAWQDHEPIMLLPDGRRVYRFYPWEARLAPSEDYLFTDVSIFDYLMRLYRDGEEIEDYRTIWYYF
ncbi:MAG: KamA family radical SAM protein [Thermoplasmata archaeon]